MVCPSHQHWGDIPSAFARQDGSHTHLPAGRDHTPHSCWPPVLCSMDSFSWGLNTAACCSPQGARGYGGDTRINFFPGHFTFLRPPSCVLCLAVSSAPSLRRRGRCGARPFLGPIRPLRPNTQPSTFAEGQKAVSLSALSIGSSPMSNLKPLALPVGARSQGKTQGSSDGSFLAPSLGS